MRHCPVRLFDAARWSFGFVVLTVAVAACSNGSPTPAPGSGAGSPSSAATTVNVTLTNDGCVPDRSSVPAGPVTFSVVNEGGESVSEVELKSGIAIIGEKEDLTPGLSGTFSLQMVPGSYVLSCPGATTPQTSFTVTAGLTLQSP